MNPRAFKLIIVGDGECGKTTFVKQKMSGNFEKKYIATIGVEVHPIKFHTSEGPVVLDVWDTAGVEKFGGLRDGYYIQAKAAILMFDLSSMTSFVHLNNWIIDVKRICENIPLLICGNKSDLERKVPLKSIEQLMQKNPNSKYIEISVINNENVDEAFLSILRDLLHSPQLEIGDNPFPLSEKDIYEQDQELSELLNSLDLSEEELKFNQEIFNSNQEVFSFTSSTIPFESSKNSISFNF